MRWPSWCQETGIISLVSGGRIRRELDGPSLKQALLEALVVEETAEAAGGTAPEAEAARDK